VDFEEVGFLSAEKDREIFVIQEVFNENIKEYRKNISEKNAAEAKNKARNIIKRGLLDIINMNKIIEVKFIDE